MKLAFLIAACAWCIAAAYRWAMRPVSRPIMTPDLARRIARQNARRYDTIDAPPAYVAPPLDVALFTAEYPDNVLPFTR